MDKLENYVEKMYEGIEEKQRAVTAVLSLARNQDNLEELLADGNLL